MVDSRVGTARVELVLDVSTLLRQVFALMRAQGTTLDETTNVATRLIRQTYADQIPAKAVNDGQ